MIASCRLVVFVIRKLSNWFCRLCSISSFVGFEGLRIRQCKASVFISGNNGPKGYQEGLSKPGPPACSELELHHNMSSTVLRSCHLTLSEESMVKLDIA